MSESALQALQLANHYLSIDRPEKSLATLARADGELLDSALYWELRARALGALDRHEEAGEAAARGLGLDGQDTDLMRLRADALAELGRLAEAERVILGALALQPEDVEPLCSYALVAARGDQVEKATRLADRAAALEPDSRRVEATRLVLAHLRGEGRRVREHARTLLADAPDDAGSHYAAGFAESSHGRAGAAARHFGMAARLDPGDPDYATAARAARYAAHPLLWPLRPFEWLGAAGTWLVAMGVILALQLSGLTAAAALAALAYVALCLYSWLVPPLLRAWLRRRSA